MAVFFGMPDDDAKALLARAMREWHPALHTLGVRVQIIMAASDTDAPAVKHGGYAALATVRIVSLKDRLTKQYDAEMLVSRLDFEQLTEGGKLALFDHELSHIDTVKKEVKQRKGYKGPKRYTVPLDDLGRPKLKLRLGDWSAGDGFAAVVRRHGDAAVEFENLRRAYDLAERAKRGEWAPEPTAGDDIEGTEDRDGVGRQLSFLDPDAGLADVVQEVANEWAAGLERNGLTATVTLHTARGPVEVHSPAPAEEPPAKSWRTLTLAETGWEKNLLPDVWGAIKGVPTAGELADKLLAGELFGLVLFDLESVYALVEMVSEDDAEPIDFDAHFNPEPAPEDVAAAEQVLIDARAEVAAFEAGAVEPAPVKPATKLADLDNFPDAVADSLLLKGISTVETLLESVNGAAYVGPEMPLRNRVVAYLVGESRDIKLKQAEYAADVVARFVEPPAPEPAREIVHCSKCKATYDATGRDKCPSCGRGIEGKVKVVDVLNLPKPKGKRKAGAK